MSASPKFFNESVRHNEWANTRWLARLREIPDLSKRTKDIFAHLLAGEQCWVRRLRGQDTSNFDPWPSLTWTECGMLIERNTEAYRTFLRKRGDDLNRDVLHVEGTETDREMPVRDVLRHVFMHSHYHRGQVAMSVQAQGFEPVNTDFTTFVQQQEEE